MRGDALPPHAGVVAQRRHQLGVLERPSGVVLVELIGRLKDRLEVVEIKCTAGSPALEWLPRASAAGHLAVDLAGVLGVVEDHRETRGGGFRRSDGHAGAWVH